MPSLNFKTTKHNCLMRKYTLFAACCLIIFSYSTYAQNGVIKTIAGTGFAGFSGDGGPATIAQIDTPKAVAVDQFGNVYISTAARIRKINPSGNITTIAGNGTSAFYGDGIPATAAQLVLPRTIIVDNSGNIFFADQNRIRKINPAGIISTVVGTGIAGFSGDGGQATDAQLYSAQGIAVDAIGNIYFSDAGNKRIRKVTPGGLISTFAGNGSATYSGDGGPATAAGLLTQGIAFDHAGNLIAADVTNNRIRKINTAGIITTIAGNGTWGLSGDGKSATAAMLGSPSDVAIDKFGNIVIADKGNNRIRLLETTSGKITTIAGGHSTYSGDNGYAQTAGFYLEGIAIDTFNDIYIADYINNRIRKITQIASVSFYLDVNSNCEMDVDEYYLYQPVTIGIDLNGTTIDTISATSSFSYETSANVGDIYTFKVLSTPSGLVTTCPSIGKVSDTILSNTGNYFSRYIGFNCSSTSGFDLAIDAVSTRCGPHRQVCQIYFSNNSCNVTNGTVVLNYSPKYADTIHFPVATSFSWNTTSWDWIGLINIGSKPYSIFSAPEARGGSLGYLTIGDTVHTSVSITPAIGDNNTANNTIVIVDTVRAGYDPNEIIVSPSGYIPASVTKLEYTINFENTGNDTAFNIYIIDSLSDYVDPKSFRILAASAKMTTTMLHSGIHNILKFDFPNINLLDSSHQGQCDGMVRFSINTYGGLGNGTTIFNHAGIYFDDNDVVMTNTVEDIVGTPNQTDAINKTNNIHLYPNPATNQLTIKTEQNTYASFTITNSMGQVLIQQPINSPQTNVDIKTLASGLYYISLKGADGITVRKFVKID
jgi:Secretion system C-terminal sorting domain